jgi:hypothetical protein
VIRPLRRRQSVTQAKERAQGGAGRQRRVLVFALRATMEERAYNKDNSSMLKLKVCRRQPAVTVLSIL